MSRSDDVFGVPGSKQHTPAEVDEHAIVDGVAAKKVFSVDLNPVAQTNPSFEYTEGVDTMQIDMVIGSDTYRKTISWVSNPITETVWTKL